MMKPGGYIVIDDMNWSWGGWFEWIDKNYGKKDQDLVQWVVGLYTTEQLFEAQMQRATRAFMDQDPSYEKVTLDQSDTDRRAVYRRIL